MESVSTVVAEVRPSPERLESRLASLPRASKTALHARQKRILPGMNQQARP